jgi:hypothetical protein
MEQLLLLIWSFLKEVGTIISQVLRDPAWGSISTLLAALFLTLHSPKSPQFNFSLKNSNLFR